MDLSGAHPALGRRLWRTEMTRTMNSLLCLRLPRQVPASFARVCLVRLIHCMCRRAVQRALDRYGDPDTDPLVPACLSGALPANMTIMPPSPNIVCSLLQIAAQAWDDGQRTLYSSSTAVHPRMTTFRCSYLHGVSVATLDEFCVQLLDPSQFSVHASRQAGSDLTKATLAMAERFAFNLRTVQGVFNAAYFVAEYTAATSPSIPVYVTGHRPAPPRPPPRLFTEPPPRLPYDFCMYVSPNWRDRYDQWSRAHAAWRLRRDAAAAGEPEEKYIETKRRRRRKNTEPDDEDVITAHGPPVAANSEYAELFVEWLVRRARALIRRTEWRDEEAAEQLRREWATKKGKVPNGIPNPRQFSVRHSLTRQPIPLGIAAERLLNTVVQPLLDLAFWVYRPPTTPPIADEPGQITALDARVQYTWWPLECFRTPLMAALHRSGGTLVRALMPTAQQIRKLAMECDAEVDTAQLVRRMCGG